MRVVVTNAGECVYLLGKGVRYGLDVWPDPSVATCAALDDVGAPSGAGLLGAGAASEGGWWSRDGGGLSLVRPTAGGPGYVLWMPELSVSPSNWNPSYGDPSETFTAVLVDVSPIWVAPGYAWRSGNDSVGQSGSYESEEMKFRWQPAEGASRTAVFRYTVADPVAEPICTEWVTVGGRRRVVNPCGVPVGGDAVFRVGVSPRDYPDSKIVWQTSGTGVVSFPNGNVGREVTVRGVSEGTVKLKAQIGSCEASPPTFGVRVVEPRTVRLSAWIVSNAEGVTPISVAGVREMVGGANDILAQVGVTLDMGNRIVVTNIPAAYDIARHSGTVAQWNISRLVDMNSGTGTIESYFVRNIIDDGNETDEDDSIIGVHSASGIVISSSGTAVTLAHEIGHAFGMADIYAERDMRYVLGRTCSSKFLYDSDWNNGCDGHGEGGERYYPCDTFQESLIRRLLMDGSKTNAAVGVDIPCGTVWGYPSDGPCSDVFVGFGDNFSSDFCPVSL